MTYADKTEYQGYWKNDMRHGFGEFTYANGDCYIGLWENDKQNGNGSYIHAATKKREIRSYKMGEL
jgi:hypothetical protein